MKYWQRVGKFDRAAVALADRHYSRRKIGSPQFMPPGQTIVLTTPDKMAVFGWWRPHPSSGIRAMNNLDGWTCTIFRNERPTLSSLLILDAEQALADFDIGPDGLLTYVWDSKIKSANPGACFKRAGWKRIGRSADGKKTLLQKMPVRALDASLGQPLASSSVTTETITEIQQRGIDARGRVIEATMALGVTVDPALIQAAMMELAAVWREEAAWFTAQKRKGHVTTSKELTQAAARLSGFAVGLTTRPVAAAPKSDYEERITDADGNVRDGRGTIIEAAAQDPFEVAEAQRVASAGKPAAEGGTCPICGSGNPDVWFTDEQCLAPWHAINRRPPLLDDACGHPADKRSRLKSGASICTLCQAEVGPVVTGDPTMDYLTGATNTYEPTPRVAGPGETVPAELTGSGPMFPGQVGYRAGEHGRPQAPCYECLGFDEDPAPWCDCTPEDGQPCKGPCRLRAHGYNRHPDGCSHRARTTNPDPSRCMYCDADLIGHNSPTNTYEPVGDPNNRMSVPTLEEALAVPPEIPAVENPFSSPAAPGSAARTAVKRLTYGELGPLIAATYPVPRPHLSHSYVESAERCGLSALLSDASRSGAIGPRRPSWSLIGGNAFHTAIEVIEKAAIELGGRTPSDSMIEGGDWGKFWETALNGQIDETKAALVGTPYDNASTWHVANKGLEGYDWWRVEGANMVLRYLAYHDDAWRAQHTLLQVPSDPTNVDSPRVPVLEFPFTVLAGTTAITAEGRIDSAWLATTSEYPTAALEVVDCKAGKSTPAQGEHFQLVEYGDVLRKHLPVNFALPIVGRYWMARKGAYSPPIPLPAPDGQAEIDYRYQAAERAMKAGVFLPSISNFCSSCGSIDVCPAQSMRDTS